MLRSIVASSVRFRLLVVPIAAVLIVLGVTQLGHTRVDVLPELNPPTVDIQTESLGLSAAEVEQLITIPMEHFLLNGIKGVDTIRSQSSPGVSDIKLVFSRGTSLLDARGLVQEQLTRIAVLPNVSAPPQMLQPVSTTSRVMMIGLSSKTLSPIQLSILARWTIGPRLLGLVGVANVAIWGQRDRQLQTLVDPERLRARHITLAQIVKTTGNAQLVSPLTFLNASTPGTGGFIDGPNQRLSIRHELPLGHASNIAQLPVDGTKGVKLGDVTHVVEGNQPLIGDAVVGGGPGLLLAIDKRPGTSTLEVTREVKQVLDEMRPGLSGVKIDTSVFEPARYIDESIDNLTIALIVAGALVLLAIAAFFMSWRAVLICVLAIPLSILAAVLVVDALGYTINPLVVAGLLMAAGLVVGDSIAATHDIVRRIRERRAAGSEESTATLVLDASAEIRTSIAYATLIVLASAAPLLLTKGVTGSFIHPLALAYAAAVVVSMLVSLTVTPALGVMLLGQGSIKRREPAIAQRLAAGYEALLARLIRTPRRVLLGLAAVGLVGIVALPFLSQPERPTFKDRDVVVRWDATPSTSLPEMDRITRRAAAQLQSLPGVRDVAADVGRAVSSDRIVETNSGEIWIRMADGADYDGTLAQVRQVADGTPGLRSEVTTYEADRSVGVLATPANDVVVRLYGLDFGILRANAERLLGLVRGVPGARNARIEGLPTSQPTLRVQVQLASALKHEIKPGDVRRAVATLTSGITVGNFFESQKVFDVVVRGEPSTRENVDSVRNLLIDTPNGGTVRLRDVATVRIAPDPVNIRHDAVSRYVDVRVQAHGRDPGDVRHDVQRRVENVNFPLEYHAEVLSNSIPGQTSHGRFLTLEIAAMIAVLLLLQAALGSWSLAFMMALVLPLATVGGVLVALAAGDLGSLGAMAGLLAVIALTLRPSIALVTRARQLQLEQEPPAGADLILRVARERFAPAVMAAVATILATIPFIALGSRAGNEITQPLAEVILGGVVTATLVSLFVLPAICLAFGLGATEERSSDETR